MKKLSTLLLLFFIGHVNAQLCYKPPIKHIGVGEWSTISGDFNNDSFMDVASYSTSKDISILLGNGTGSLTLASTFSVSGRSSINYQTELVARDFNNDGNLDIATIRNTASQVSLFLGTGTGSFVPTSVTNTVGTQPASIISTDFNNDGKMDLAVANISAKNVSVLLGTGTGSFNAAVTVPMTLGIPKSITSGDFNSDGKTDLAVGIQTVTIDHKIAIFTGNGLGNFTAGTSFTVANSFPYTIETMDFNADGKLDLVCGKGNVGVFLGTGLGSFGAEAMYNVPGGYYTNVLCGDYNSDGIADIATGCNGTSEISILLGTGSGSFNTALKYPAGIHPMSIASADFNNDSRPDFAVGLDLSGGMNVLLNGPLTVSVTGNLAICSGNTTTLSVNGANTYTWSANAGSATTATVSVTPTSTTVYSINVTNGSCPTTPKLVVVNVTTTPTISISQSAFSGCRGGSATLTATGATSYTWSSNAGGGHSNAVTVFPTCSTQYSVLGANGSCSQTMFALVNVVPDLLFNGPNRFLPGTSAYSTITKDFNNDGKLDIIYGDQIALGDGSGGFSTVMSTPVNSAWSATAADFNNDGNQDIATANGNANVLVSLGIGNGSFSGVSTLIAGTLPSAITSADFNGDSNIDLAVANANTNNVSVFMGTGNGSFSAATNFTVFGSSGSFASICSEDFNSDGKKDIVVAGSSGGCILLGTGTGSFMPCQYIPVGVTNSMITADIDNDGDFDLVYISSNALHVVMGLGNGTFFSSGALSSGIAAGVAAQRIISADFNIDNFPDVAVTDINANVVYVLLGSGNGTFRSVTTYNVFNGSGTVALTAGDFTGNGRIDLAVGNYGPAGISILLNGLDIKGNTDICSGTSTSLTCSQNLSSYSWLPNVGSGTSATVSPSVTTTYSVSGVFSSCNYNLTNSVTVNVTVTPSPSITPANTVICLGQTAMLTASGASNYLWSAPGNSTASVITFTPWHGSGSYLVGVQSTSYQCVGTASAMVTVSSPTISINTQTDCMVITNTLIASGANTYTWSTNQQGGSIAVNPLSTTVYTVTGTDVYGCSSGTYISVGPNPTANFNYTVNNMTVGFEMKDSVNCPGGGFLWDYGNGMTSTVAKKPFVTYVNSGIYTACLKCNALPSNCVVCSNINVPGNYSASTSYVGIQEIKESDFSIKYYPNPTDGILTVDSERETAITVLGLLGETLFTQKLKQGINHIDLSNQANGVYFMRTGHSIFKIIKQ